MLLFYIVFSCLVGLGYNMALWLVAPEEVTKTYFLTTLVFAPVLMPINLGAWILLSTRASSINVG